MLPKFVLKTIFFLALFALFQQTLQAQRHTISGYLTDARNGEKLISAKVYDQLSSQGTLTNNFGFFSLSLKTGTVKIIAAQGSYQSKQIEFELRADTVMNLSLTPYALDEVQIIAENEEKIQERTEMSTISIPIDQIKKLPALMGEVDVIKAIQLLPGVQSGSEGSTGIYVRGGGPDQNLILLDDVPLYYVSHLGGFFSVFNADALSNVKLVKGGFPARYGGRLSSVLDIRMKEGNMKKFEAEGSIGLISSKLSIQGPIIKDKTSFIVSGRRTYFDLLSRPISQAASGGVASFGYYFYDLNAKINHIISDKDRLYLSTYMGDDNLGIRVSESNGVPGDQDYYDYGIKNKTLWGNKLAALRWNHIWSPKLFSNLTATFTNYRFQVGNELYDAYTSGDSVVRIDANLNYQSGIRDFGGKLDFDFYPVPSHDIKFGINTTRHRFVPGFLGYKISAQNQDLVDTTLAAQVAYSLETSAYIEDNFKIGRRFSANVGLHAVHYIEGEKNYFSFQPRISTRFLLSDNVSIKGSYVQMTQFIHLLANSSVGLPIDIWVPATDKIAPQDSWQAAFGIASSLWGDKFEFSVEGYYKKMDNLIEYKEGTNFFLGISDQNWQDIVETGGTGEAYGVELFLQKKTGNTTGWIGYTLAWNNRQFESLNQGDVYPYKFDRRHDASVVVIHKINDKVSISGTWVYGTGNALTLPSGGYATVNYPGSSIFNENGTFGRHVTDLGWSNGGVQLYENGRNNFRMEAYHRLDFGINFRKEKKWGERTWNISVYNAYSRQNPYTYFIGRDYNNQTQAGPPPQVLRRLALFPIIPSVSYIFKIT